MQYKSEKCEDCITPLGTRCESEPSTCLYHEKQIVIEQKSYKQINKYSIDHVVRLGYD